MSEVICIDFDRTLHDMDHPVAGRKMGPPIESARTAVQVLMSHGYEVVVLTCQVNHEYIRDWLRYYGFPALRVTNVKPVAVAYVDDRAVRFTGSWLDTMAQLQEALR